MEFTKERAGTLQFMLWREVEFVDTDDEPLTFEVEALEDCYWITYTRADKPDWTEGHSIGSTYDEALAWVGEICSEADDDDEQC